MTFGGVCTAQVVSYAFNAQQRLGRSPLINAEAKNSVILICSGRFFVVLGACCRHVVDHPCISDETSLIQLEKFYFP